MQFFTQIGIDWRLLVAQIINFGILLFLLNKYLFKPVIKQIQQEERDRAEVNKTKQSLENIKDQVKKETEDDLADAREKSRAIIAEAARLAEEMKQQTTVEQRALNEKFLQQLKEESDSLVTLYEEKVIQRERSQAVQRAIHTIDKTLDPERKEALEAMFFERLLASVEKARMSQKRSQLPMRLEYALSISPKKHKQLEKLLAEKLRLPQVELDTKKNPDLVSGFTLQAGGIFFSQNIAETMMEKE